MIVVKVGGAVGRRAQCSRSRLEDAVVVHGGGPQISRRWPAAGLEVAFVGGRRVTDAGRSTSSARRCSR